MEVSVLASGWLFEGGSQAWQGTSTMWGGGAVQGNIAPAFPAQQNYQQRMPAARGLRSVFFETVCCTSTDLNLYSLVPRLGASAEAERC